MTHELRTDGIKQSVLPGKSKEPFKRLELLFLKRDPAPRPSRFFIMGHSSAILTKRMSFDPGKGFVGANSVDGKFQRVAVSIPWFFIDP